MQVVLYQKCLYFFLGALNFLLKKASDIIQPILDCCNIVLTMRSEASIASEVQIPGLFKLLHRHDNATF